MPQDTNEEFDRNEIQKQNVLSQEERQKNKEKVGAFYGRHKKEKWWEGWREREDANTEVAKNRRDIYLEQMEQIEERKKRIQLAKDMQAAKVLRDGGESDGSHDSDETSCGT